MRVQTFRSVLQIKLLGSRLQAKNLQGTEVGKSWKRPLEPFIIYVDNIPYLARVFTLVEIKDNERWVRVPVKVSSRKAKIEKKSHRLVLRNRTGRMAWTIARQ